MVLVLCPSCSVTCSEEKGLHCYKNAVLWSITNATTPEVLNFGTLSNVHFQQPASFSRAFYAQGP